MKMVKMAPQLLAIYIRSFFHHLPQSHHWSRAQWAMRRRSSKMTLQL